MSFEEMMEDNERNKRCAAAMDTLKLFMEDAKQQLKSSIPLNTLELIVASIDKEV